MTKLSKLCLSFLLGTALLAAQQTVQYGYDAAGRLISAGYDNGTSIAYTYDDAGNLLQRDVSAGAPFASLSSASFEVGAAFAAEMIASGFGVGVATGTADATQLPLPTELLGTRIEVTDSAGVTRLSALFAVRENQANYLIPAGTALGEATVKVTSGAGKMLVGVLEIERVSPGIYTANAQGTGVVGGLVIRIKADDSVEQSFTFNPDTRAAVPIDLGAAGDRVFVAIFGTGMRGTAGAVSATVGGIATGVLGPVAQGQFAGLDQANLGPLSRELMGRGEVEIEFTLEGKTANTTTLNIL